MLDMRNDDQTAVIVMDTGSESPSPFAEAVFAILDKRKGYEFKTPPAATGVNLEDYAGRYSEQPWGSEMAILPWAGGLVSINLPTNDPAGDMSFLKPKGGDIFRRVRKDGSEAEEVKFVRDGSGKVTSVVHHSNVSHLESRLPDAKVSVKQ